MFLCNAELQIARLGLAHLTSPSPTYVQAYYAAARDHQKSDFVHVNVSDGHYKIPDASFKLGD